MYIYIKKYEINYILDKNRFVLLLENFFKYFIICVNVCKAFDF